MWLQSVPLLLLLQALAAAPVYGFTPPYWVPFSSIKPATSSLRFRSPMTLVHSLLMAVICGDASKGLPNAMGSSPSGLPALLRLQEWVAARRLLSTCPQLHAGSLGLCAC